MPPVHRVSVLALWLFAAGTPLFSSAPIVRSAADSDRGGKRQDLARSPRGTGGLFADCRGRQDGGHPPRGHQTEASVSCAGRPIDRMAWKTIRPGIHSGYWESYKSEIAAYELDKLLGLEMIPPTVERRVQGDLGAAVMWVAPIKSFKDLGGPPSAPADKLAAWSRQLIRAKMFDNLICNIDPNLGNWLVDPSWNLILIDHTRSFTTKKDMVHQLTRVDQELWDRMKTLTVESLTPALEKWIGKREIGAIIERRDRIQGVIDKLVAAKGEAAVFVR